MNDLSVLRMRYNQKSINITKRIEHIYHIRHVVKNVSHEASCIILKKKMGDIQWAWF
jgi:hypothetical protein